MDRSPRAPRVWLAALACAGLAGAHWLTYFVAGAHDHARADLLASTGHSYWPYFAAVAIACLVGALGRPLTQGFRGGTHAPLRPAGMVGLLTAIQMGGFLVLEIGERALFAPGHSLNVLAEPVVLGGLVLQVLTAVVATVVVRLMMRAGDALRRLWTSLAPADRSSSTRWFTTQIAAPVPVPVAGGASLRGPPPSL